MVVKSVEAGEATHIGVAPGPWLDRRLPLVPATQDERDRIRKVLEEANLL